MKYALDTNIAVAALNGVDSVMGRLANVPPSEILLPDPVVAELLFGAHTSARVAENVATVPPSVHVLSE